MRTYMFQTLMIVAALVFADPARAQDDVRPWTASLGLSRFFAGADDASGDSASLSFSLARSFGATTVGVSLGATRRDVLFPDSLERSDGEAFAVGASLAHDFAETDVALLFDYALEDADFLLNLANAPVAATAGSDFLSVALAVSRAFGDRTRIVPSASGGWSRSTAEIISSGPIGLNGGVAAEGWSGAAGLFLAQDVGSRWTLSAGGSAILAEEASALAITRGGGRTGRARGLFTGLQTIDQRGSLVYGEVAAGLSSTLGRVTLSTDAAHSVGLDTEYFSLTSTVSVSF